MQETTKKQYFISEYNSQLKQRERNKKHRDIGQQRKPISYIFRPSGFWSHSRVVSSTFTTFWNPSLHSHAILAKRVAKWDESGTRDLRGVR